ncbi:hypothetical protein [Okeania sp. SIO2C9]|nr:hypothetical protein [Okeania sp. SIO2C9]
MGSRGVWGVWGVWEVWEVWEVWGMSGDGERFGNGALMEPFLALLN